MMYDVDIYCFFFALPLSPFPQFYSDSDHTPCIPLPFESLSYRKKISKQVFFSKMLIEFISIHYKNMRIFTLFKKTLDDIVALNFVQKFLLLD